jgi:hypothetical protein
MSDLVKRSSKGSSACCAGGYKCRQEVDAEERDRHEGAHLSQQNGELVLATADQAAVGNFCTVDVLVLLGDGPVEVEAVARVSELLQLTGSQVLNIFKVVEHSGPAEAILSARVVGKLEERKVLTR